MDTIQNQSSYCVAERSENKRQLCVVCDLRPKNDYFFAECNHNGSCIKCAQKHMLKMIQKNKYPTCVINNGCQSKMVYNKNTKDLNNKCLFQLFSDTGKKNFQFFLDNLQVCSLPRCKVPKCKGVIDRFKCLKCSQDYCERCFQYSHSIKIKCKQFDPSLVKKCPFCNWPYQKNQNISTKCQDCSNQFCNICLKQWSLPHQDCVIKKFQSRIVKKKSQKCCSVF